MADVAIPSSGGAHVAVGEFTGDGTATRTISVGFEPAVVFLSQSGGFVDPSYDRLVIRGVPTQSGTREDMLEIEGTGFKLTKPNGTSYWPNQSGIKLKYVALRSVADVCIPVSLPGGCGKYASVIMMWDEVQAATVTDGIQIPNGKTLWDVAFHIAYTRPNAGIDPPPPADPGNPYADELGFYYGGYWDGDVYRLSKHQGTKRQNSSYDNKTATVLPWAGGGSRTVFVIIGFK